MSAVEDPRARELVALLASHLDDQLRSVVRLRGAVDALGAAIRVRDVPAVLRHTGTLEAETTFRATLEERRSDLLRRGGSLLGVAPHDVTVAALCALVGPVQASEALRRSDELLRSLEDVARQHRTNRALMQQELAFLDHLLRLDGAPPEPTYEPPRVQARRAAPTAVPAAPHRRALDLRA